MIVKDEAILRKKCEDVLPEEVDNLRAELEKELMLSAARGEPGIGLAAPQIGIHKRMAIVRVKDQNGRLYSADLVNCKISQSYDKAIFNEEGCLSFPGQTVQTYRYREIYVTGNLIAPHSFIATGLFAVCIQHEIDHLNGILLPDVAIAPINKPLQSKIGKLELDKLTSVSNFMMPKRR